MMSLQWKYVTKKLSNVQLVTSQLSRPRTWWHKGPVRQQPWYWHSPNGIFEWNHLKVTFFYFQSVNDCVTQLSMPHLLMCFLHHTTHVQPCSVSSQWRHNGRWRLKSTASRLFTQSYYSAADQRKHQSSASLALVRGIHRGPVNSPHKWPVTRKMFPFDDVIMIPHDTEKYGPPATLSISGGQIRNHQFDPRGKQQAG